MSDDTVRLMAAWQRGYLAGRLAGLTQAAGMVCDECALAVVTQRRREDPCASPSTPRG